jgi:hypothetical protein
MKIEEFADLLERLDAGEEPLIPFNLHGGIRNMGDTSPDTTSANHYGWGLSAWSQFFRDLASTEYPAAKEEPMPSERTAR